MLALPRRLPALALCHLCLAPGFRQPLASVPASTRYLMQSPALPSSYPRRSAPRRRAKAKFSKLRRDATTVVDKADRRAPIADRRLDTRLKGLARQSFGQGLGTEGVVYLTVDGMDQAKFDGLWRPQLHVVGALVPGLLEAYFGMNADVPADSNLTMTVVAQAIHHVATVCSMRGIKVPEHLVLLAPSARLPRWRWSRGHDGRMGCGGWGGGCG